MPINIPTENASILSRHLAIEEEQQSLFKILTGKKIDDVALSQKVAEGFVLRSIAEANIAKAIKDKNNVVFPVGTKSDLVATSAMMLGLNDNGESLISDETVQKELLENILLSGLAETGQSKLVNSEIAHGLIAYAASPDEIGFHPKAKEVLSEFLTDSRMKSLLEKVADGRLSNPVSEDCIEPLYDKFKINQDPKEPEYNSKSPDNKDFQPVGAKLSDESLDNDVIALEEAATNAYSKKKIAMDLQTDAQLRINAIMDREGNENLVHRALVNKLVDRVKQGTLDAFDSNHLVYPKESIFSETVSQLDTNGRVVKELFAFRESGIFNSANIKFKDPQPSDDALDLAALHALRAGIVQPHVHCKFREPVVAIGFMERTVNALVNAGYDIDDISVDPHLKQAFDHYVLKYHHEELTISEAPKDVKINPEDPNFANKTEPKPLYESRQLMPIELVNSRRDTINLDGERIAANLDPASQLPLTIKDLTDEDLQTAMSLSALVDEASDDWSVNLKDVTLAPSLVAPFKRVKEELSKILDRADPTNDVKNTSGIPEQKIISENQGLFREIFKGDPRIDNVFGNVLQSQNSKYENPIEGARKTNNNPVGYDESIDSDIQKQAINSEAIYRNHSDGNKVGDPETARLKFIFSVDRLEATRENMALNPSGENKRSLDLAAIALEKQKIAQSSFGNPSNFDLGVKSEKELKIGYSEMVIAIYTEDLSKAVDGSPEQAEYHKKIDEHQEKISALKSGVENVSKQKHPDSNDLKINFPDDGVPPSMNGDEELAGMERDGDIPLSAYNEESMQDSDDMHDNYVPPVIDDNNPKTEKLVSKGDVFMMSIAKIAKKNDGSLNFMSSKQILEVSRLDGLVNLPDGDPKKMLVSNATKSMVEKVKTSIFTDIEKMKSGVYIDKERYKAIVSQPDKVISSMAGLSALSDLDNIKAKHKNTDTPSSVSAPVEYPEVDSNLGEKNNPAKVEVPNENKGALGILKSAQVQTYPIEPGNPYIKEISDKQWDELSPSAVEFILSLDEKQRAFIRGGLPKAFEVDPTNVKDAVGVVIDTLDELLYLDFAVEVDARTKDFVKSLPDELVPFSTRESLKNEDVKIQELKSQGLINPQGDNDDWRAPKNN